MNKAQVDTFSEHSVFDYISNMKELAKPLQILGINFFAQALLKNRVETQYLVTSEYMATECANLGYVRKHIFAHKKN